MMDLFISHLVNKVFRPECARWVGRLNQDWWALKFGLADVEDFTAGDKAVAEGCVMPSLRKAIDRRLTDVKITL